MLAALLLAMAAVAQVDAVCADAERLERNTPVSLPKVIDKPKPEYATRKAAGLVLMDALICADGRVHDASVVIGVPWARSLDASALEAVRRWRYTPAMRDGRPVPVYLTVAIDFAVDLPGPAWWRQELNLRLHDTTLDRALAVFEKAGIEIDYRGSAPPVHATYEKKSVQAVLDDLARRYALEMELVPPRRLRVRALPGPGSEGILPPVLEARTEPGRPDLHGTVELNLVVAADGSVQTATVVRPSGKADFDADALESVRSWRYHAASRDGKPVAVYVPIRIER